MKNRKPLLLLSIILIVVTIATLFAVNTFSWYNRTAITHTDKGNNLLTYEKTGSINYDTGDSTVVTYLGTIKKGEIVYDETTPVSVTQAVSVKAGTPTYFKTVITNNDTSGDSMISVYLSSLSWSADLGNTIHIGIYGPEKTYTDVTSSTQNAGRTCIEDNIVLENNTSVEVIWFVKSDTAADGTVTLGSQYPVYN